ncbi:protein-export membrane protein SecD [[Phormidium ambiguum] IAM M-71]|uniref:Protein translocase subunit SecD n=1 Tax=[Phormidium ambiguum] IAM M-71 TaxID=454136 RepID=A0A1U7IP34_9CYAN|nr:protein translocase subunit SecD [Phormidium ambiguum]OKH39128.1 protein-export membrane protein SecD [Phormidium ambiguum IAM M-71]
MGKQRPLLAVIFVLVITAIVVLIQFPIRLGLDLQGGSQLTLQVKQTDQKREITDQDLEAIQNVVEKRINALGVSEAVVQTVGNNQLLVQLPGVKDPQEAERVLGGTAQLEFRQEANKPEVQAQLQVRQTELALLQQKKAELAKGNDEAAIAANAAQIKQKTAELQALQLQIFESVGLTGKNLKTAEPQTDQSNQWNVALEFDTEGAEKFAQLTKNIAGTGRSIGIFLDNELISSPIVDVQYANTGIVGGRAIINGNFDTKTAYELAVQLRGGALPFPVEVVENRTVGATLGRDSIQRSIYAGVVGLILVLIFMVVYYRLPGAIADIALLIYALLTLAAFALIGVTLTLPGIAGFILSIGMAVDANVLIFERTREELRAGKSLYRSVESGFYRAFSSILDSNVTTGIACIALIIWGTGLVKGFAVTLLIGVLVSMFTAITCSRTLMMLAITIPEFRKPELFVPKTEVVR